MIDYYDSIHNLPQYYWYKISKTGDYKYLLKEGKLIPKKVNLVDVWENIHSEYIDEFGFSDTFIKYITLRCAGAKLLSKAYLTNNKSLLSIANAKFKKAEQLMEEVAESNYSLDDVAATLTKFMGVPVRPKEITVVEFNSYARLRDRELKAKSNTRG